MPLAWLRRLCCWGGWGFGDEEVVEADEGEVCGVGVGDFGVELLLGGVFGKVHDVALALHAGIEVDREIVTLAPVQFAREAAGEGAEVVKERALERRRDQGGKCHNRQDEAIERRSEDIDQRANDFHHNRFGAFFVFLALDNRADQADHRHMVERLDDHVNGANEK